MWRVDWRQIKMKNKLDKAIKEEQERFEEYAEVQEWGSLDDRREILQFLETSYKRIAKAALEASKLEEEDWQYDYYDVEGMNSEDAMDVGVEECTKAQHTKIQKLLKEI